jgi:protein-S-isoprenylcysteine O-methyltransferase Ste14
MSEPSAFRLALALVALAFVLLWLWTFWRGGRGRGALWTRSEGLLTGISLRLLLALSLGAIFLEIARPALLAWARLPLPAWLRWTGLPLALVCLALFLRAQRALDRHFRASLGLGAEHRLIVHGPYARVRHPMYVAFTGIFLACFLLSANGLIGITGLGAEALNLLLRAPREEKMMAARFGGEYESYRRRTGRFLPRRP